MTTERIESWDVDGSGPMTPEQRRMLNAVCGDLLYEPETGLFRWRRDGRGQTKRAGAIAGSAHSGGYIRIKTGGKTYFAHRLAWLFVHGAWPPDEVDHINRDRTDNRIENLRLATTAENRRNTGGIPRRRKKSRFKGVYPQHNSPNRWGARICANGKSVTLGSFATQQEAAAAYRAAALRYHGEFAGW